MEKEFIPYTLSLELKELGFDEPCIGFWWNNKDFTEPEFLLEYCEHLMEGNLKRPLYQQAFKFVLAIIENDFKLNRKFKTRFFLDFTYKGFVMDDNELSTTYESDEETLREITNFIILNK